MKNRLKKLIRTLLPYQYHFYFFTKGRNYSRSWVRQDCIQFYIQDGVYLEAYWKVYGIGKGPALILNIFGEELLRFDFFGPGKGHYHVTVPELQPQCSSFLYLSEQKVADQIERALFELNHNMSWYLQRHPLAKIRNLKINKKKLEELTPHIRTTLLVYAKLVEP